MDKETCIYKENKPILTIELQNFIINKKLLTN